VIRCALQEHIAAADDWLAFDEGRELPGELLAMGDHVLLGTPSGVVRLLVRRVAA
jgi:hypothetical protein